MAKRDNLGGGSRTAPNSPGADLGPNPNPDPLVAGGTASGPGLNAPATQGTDPNLPNQGWGDSGRGLQNQGMGSQGEQDRQGDQGVAQQAKDQAKDLARQAKDQTSKMANQAKDQVNQLVSQRKDQAAERLGSFASVLRDTAGKLNEQDENGIGQYANRAADQVERLSNYLRDRDVSSFLRDSETFARRHPDVFLGGVFLAGLVLARFFKASGDRDDWNRDVQRYSGSYEPFGGGRYGEHRGEGRPYTTERYPGTGTGEALENPRPFQAEGV
jgi:hypothetical protein